MARRRRTRTAVLEAHSGGREPGGRVRLRMLPWRVIVVLSSLGTAVSSWLIVTAFCSLGWLSQSQASYGEVLDFATRAWLLGHGVPMTIEGLRVSVIPLGFALLVMVVGSSMVASIARHLAIRDFGGRARTERQDARARSLTLQLAVWFTAPYLAVLVMATGFSGEPSQIGRALIGGLLICGPVPAMCAGRALGWSAVGFGQRGWLRGIGVGVWTAVGTLIAVSAVVFLATLIAHHAQVSALHQALNPGTLGGVVMSLGQIAWVPNAVLWTAAWLLGAGFSVGQGTLFTPLASTVGPIPDIPLLGVLPTVGAHSSATVAWLLVGVLAGAVGAFVAVRGRRNQDAQALPARELSSEEGALCGLGVGVVSGAVMAVLMALSCGSLGVTRLRDLGPVMPRAVVLATTLMGAGGLAVGYAFMQLSKGRWRTFGPRRGTDSARSDDHRADTSGTSVKSAAPGIVRRPAERRNAAIGDDDSSAEEPDNPDHGEG